MRGRALPPLMLLLGLARASAQLQPRRVGVSPLGESENDAASPPDAAFNAGMQAGLDALQKAAADEGGAVPDLFGNLKNNELMKNLVDGNPEFRELLSDPEAMQAWLSLSSSLRQ